MNARLRKEFHPLVFPGCLVALCALVSLAKLFSPARNKNSIMDLIRVDSAFDQFISFISGIGLGGVALGIIFLAAIAFGVEFHQQTFVLLLSQPAERLRIWRDKIIALAVVVVMLSILLVPIATATDVFTGDNFWESIGPSILFIVVVVCSTGYWTLLARSTMGGMVFSLSAMFVIGSITLYAFDKIFALSIHPTTPARESLLIITIAAVGFLYAGICLWFGWRRFANMELRDITYSEGLSLPGAFPGLQWVTNLVRCQPKGAVRNLIRKELHLHKTTFLLAVLFTACWLLTLLLLLAMPARSSYFETTFNVLTAFYIPLLALLAGCVPLGEENSMGVAAWHLTFPFSTRRQWVIKLGVGAMVCALLAFALPLVLAVLTSFKMKVGLVYLLESAMRGTSPLLSMVAFIFILSFWGASLMGNTVRATVMAVLACVVIAVLAPVAGWIADHLGGLQQHLLAFLTTKLHLPPRTFQNLGDWPGFMGLFLGMSIVALAQSIRSFRRARIHEGIPLRQLLILALTTFLLMIWALDFRQSAMNFDPLLLKELSAAFSKRFQESDFPPISESARKITLDQFDDVQSLPAGLKSWLKNTTITLAQPRDYPGTKNNRMYYVWFHFPDQDEAVQLHFPEKQNQSNKE